MLLRRLFMAGLLGCTVLAGCDGDDKAPAADGVSQGTFDALKTTTDQQSATIGELKARLAGVEQRLTGTQTDVTTLQGALAGARGDISGLQGRIEAVESGIAGLKALTARLETVDGKLAALENTALTTDEQTSVTTLKTTLASLKSEIDIELNKKLVLTDLNDLTTKVAALETGKVDKATLDGLTVDIKTRQEALDAAAKLGTTSTEDFKKRITELEAAVDTLRPRVDMALTQFVNPFVGTTMSDSGSGHSGNVNPGAQTPFGMVSFGPDTRGSGAGWGEGSGGYYHDDTTIRYFSTTHLNGPGCRGQGAVALLPLDTSGDISTAGIAYGHANEQAEPGYYKVKFDNGISSELTATTRTGMARFTYADKDKAFLVIDTARNNSNQGGIGYKNLVDIKLGDDRQSVSGNAVAHEFCGGTWKQPVYFYAAFDKKLKPAASIVGKAAKLQFDLTDTDRSVLVKVGISSVSVANAKENLAAENAGWSFEDIKVQSSKNWNTRLNTVQIDLAKGEPAALSKTAKDNLTKFYTAFYRVFSGPTVYSDINGDYRSMKQANLSESRDALPTRAVENVSRYRFKVDGKDAGYKTHYSGFSMWDTYRSQAQMLALVAPDEASDMMQSLVADAQQCGAFPHWVDGSEDTQPMNRDHAPNVIAGSYMFGARKFDLENTRKYMKQSAFNIDSKCNDKVSYNGGSLKDYIEKNYIPDRSSGTIEYLTTDRSIAAFLSRLSGTKATDESDIAKLFTRARNWTNIFDSSSKTMKARNAKGQFVGGDFHEGTEEHYIWTFAHDWTSLIEKLGGKAAAIARLNALFTIPASTPFTGAGTEPTGKALNSGESGHTYYIGNEPAFQTPWAYNWAGAPKYAQYIIPIIMNKNFSLAAGGLPGNDDMGATSGWYVWAALGLYPVIPSEGGLAVSTPQFDGITLWLGNGKKLRIETGGKQAIIDKIPYIKEMRLGDATYQGTWLPLEKIANGGKLSFTLSATPTEWGAGDDLTPPSGPDADYSKPTAKPLSGPQIIQ